ncbi:MAG: peptidoglycan DD-metalloendopeptidase family protein [Chitinophagaceae bacterium]
MIRSSLALFLKQNVAHFGPVVSFSPGTDKLLQLDLSDANEQLTEAILQDTSLFTHYINNKLKHKGARYGIGGYAEHRSVYSRSKLFGAPKSSIKANSVVSGASKETEEPRRLHLGTDIWGKPHTAVMAPLDGLVHSFANNDAFGDYGATIILTHQLSGVSFYTLYGHLSLNSIKNLQVADRIKKGDLFAEFGIPAENGQWPPHLHFQIIADLQGKMGDFPGVCKLSEKESWMANCPDPELILQLNEFI